MGLADYTKLVALLGEAFDDTAQRKANDLLPGVIERPPGDANTSPCRYRGVLHEPD